MKAACTWCRQRWSELQQSGGIGTAAYVKDIGADDPAWSTEDIVRHNREQHEVGIEALAAKVGLPYVNP